MPKPIVCLSEQLRQYLEVFRPCFRKSQWNYFVTVLLGLIECEERRTMTGFLRVVGERISLSGLSRFLSKWHWSPKLLGIESNRMFWVLSQRSVFGNKLILFLDYLVK